MPENKEKWIRYGEGYKNKPVVRKVTFAESENADDEYWANATAEERLQELIELRRMFFGETIGRIKKIVS
jgi:hypothetical protein